MRYCLYCEQSRIPLFYDSAAAEYVCQVCCNVEQAYDADTLMDAGFVDRRDADTEPLSGFDRPGRRNRYRRSAYFKVRLAQWRTLDPVLPAAAFQLIKAEALRREPSGARAYPPFRALTKFHLHRICRAVGLRKHGRSWIKIKRLLLDAPVPCAPSAVLDYLDWFHAVLQEPFEQSRGHGRKHFIQINYLVHQALLNLDAKYNSRTHAACHSFFPLLKGRPNLERLDALFADMVTHVPPELGIRAFPLARRARQLVQRRR